MPPNSHSEYGASKAARILACPGSVCLCHGLEDVPGPYAEEGRRAHDLAESCLRQGIDAETYLNRRTPDGTFVSQDMVDAVQIYLDYVRAEVARLPGSELLIEQPFDLSWLGEDLRGTNDATVRQPFGHMSVVDYKHGAGVAVKAEDNSQLLYYGAGALRESVSVETVTLTIVQPRALGEPIDEWETTPQYIEAWTNDVLKPAMAHAHALLKAGPDEAVQHLHAGDHCMFCLAKHSCPKLRDNAMAMAELSFDPIKDDRKVILPDAYEMDGPRLARAIDLGELLSLWLKALREEAQNRLRRGEEVPGYKLVEGRATRRWADETAAADILPPEVAMVTSLRTVAQAEKAAKELLGLKPKDFKEQYGSLIEVRRGVSLAPVSDKRQAIDVNPFQPLIPPDPDIFET